MQVKKFEAPTIQEALDTIKRELGPEAIILQTKKYKRGFGLMSRASIEVTAAVSERSIQKKEYAETRLPPPAREKVGKLPAERQAKIYDKYASSQMARAEATSDRVSLSRGAPTSSKPITSMRYADIDAPAPQATPQPQSRLTRWAQEGLENTPAQAANPMADEIRHLKRMIEEMKSTQDQGMSGSGTQMFMPSTALGTPALQDAFEQMVINGIDKRYAHGLLKKVAFELGTARAGDPDAVSDQLASELMQSAEVVSPLSGITPRSVGEQRPPSVIALVGPTGVGKTTTIAKMASEALLRRGLKVGLVNFDTYKVAAFDQLGTFARILNVPFRSASSIEDLKAALADFQALDLVLVDTTGRSQRDPRSLKEMQDALSQIPELTSHLVLSVTTRDNELYDMASRFAVFHPQGLIISKLDEATIYGAIYNVSQKVKLPLLYFTTGQRVPEDIEEATPERVAALVLDI